MDSFHYTSPGNRLETGYPYDEPPFSQRNDPHTFYPSYNPSSAVSRSIGLVLDPEVEYDEKKNIVLYLVYNVLTSSSHVADGPATLAQLFLGILALDGDIPGCTKGATPLSLLRLCQAAAGGLVGCFEVPGVVSAVLGYDEEGPRERDLEGRLGEVEEHVQTRCDSAKERVVRASARTGYPTVVGSMQLTARQSICVLLRHGLDREGKTFKEGKEGIPGPTLPEMLEMDTALTGLRLACITALHEAALLGESVDVSGKPGAAHVNVLHMLCEEGAHIAITQAILARILAEAQTRASGTKAEEQSTPCEIDPEQDELALQLRTLELCIEQLQIEATAKDAVLRTLSLHPLTRLEIVRALVLACSPQQESKEEQSTEGDWQTLVGIPSFVEPFRAACALACARLLLLSGMTGNLVAPGTPVARAETALDMVGMLAGVPIGSVIQVAVPFITSIANGTSGQSGSLMKDIRTLMCGIVGSLWDSTREDKEDPLTPFLPSLCATLTSRSNDDPTYVLDICRLLQKSSKNPSNLSILCDKLKNYPIILQSCVDTPYALQDAAYIDTMAATLGRK